MHLIYVAHAIRDNRGLWYLKRNIRRAEAVALELWLMGAAVICPGKNTEDFDGAAQNEIWLAGDLEMLGRCDAIVMAPGWENSVGATKELEYASLHDLRIFYWPQDKTVIQQYIEGGK